MDGSAGYYSTASNPNAEIQNGLLQRMSRFPQEAVTPRSVKKTVRISLPDAGRSRTASTTNSSTTSSDRAIENGLLKRAPWVSSRATDAAVRNASSGMQLSARKDSTLPAQPSAEERRKSPVLHANSVIQSTAERSNSQSTPASDMSSNWNMPFVRVNRSSAVQPVGKHLLLKRFTANSKAIEPFAVSSTRNYGSFAQQAIDQGQPKKSSIKFIDTPHLVPNSNDGTSLRTNFSNQPTPVVEVEQARLKRYSTKAIDAAPGKFLPGHSSKSDGVMSRFEAEPEPVVEVPQGFLENFSANTTDAPLRFTPLSTSSADHPITYTDRGLLKNFSPNSIDAAVRSSPLGSSSTDYQPTLLNSKNFSPEPIDREIISAPGSLERYTGASSEGATSRVKVEPAPLVDAQQGLLKKFSVETTPFLVESSSSDSTTVSSVDEHEPLANAKQGLLKKFSAKAIDAAVRFTPLGSSSADQPIADRGLLKKFSAKAIEAAVKSSPALVDHSNDGATSSGESNSISFGGPGNELDHGLLMIRSSEAADSLIKFNIPSGVESSSSGRSSLPTDRTAVKYVHGLLKKFSPEDIDAAVRFIPSSKETVDDAYPKTDSESEPIDAGPESETPVLRTSYPENSTSSIISDVKNAPPKLFGPRAKKGGVLDIDEPKAVRICVLGVRGRVLYLEVYKDFVDLMLNFLNMRTGAVIKLLRELDTGLEFGGSGCGVLNVYDSLSKLSASMLTVDKDMLLDPSHKLKLTKELQSLDSFELECCNTECPKFMSSSRLVCKYCTISNHFSCSICNGYFRDGLHTAVCYPPWRPWGTHVSAAPVLNRYTVVQSIDTNIRPKSQKRGSRDAQSGFVKHGIPFMVTNELNISPLTTRSIAKVLKTLGDEGGKTEELDCHELLIGKAELVFLLGAAMTSITPLTDVFAHMCKSENKISATGILSGSTILSQELGKRASNIAKPLGDLMTYVRPIASGIADALQQGTEAALKKFSDPQGAEKHETSKVDDEDSQTPAAVKKKLSTASSQAFSSEVTSKGIMRTKSSLLATPQLEDSMRKRSSLLTTPQLEDSMRKKSSLFTGTPQLEDSVRKKSSSLTTPQLEDSTRKKSSLLKGTPQLEDSTRKKPSLLATPQLEDSVTKKSSLLATPLEHLIPEASRKKSSVLATPTDLIPEISPPTETKKKSVLAATTSDVTSETLEATDKATTSPATEGITSSAAEPSGSDSKTTEAADILLPGEKLPQPTAASTSDEILQRESQEGLGLNQPNAEIMANRKSSTILQPKSPEKTDEESSPTSTSRLGFLNKLFSPCLIVVIKAFKDMRGKKKEVEPGSTPSATLTSTTPPPSKTDFETTEVQSPATGVQLPADGLETVPPDPTSDPTQTPKEPPSSKIFSQKTSMQLPDITREPPATPSPIEEKHLSAGEESNERDVKPLPTENPERPALPTVAAQEAQVSILSPAAPLAEGKSGPIVVDSFSSDIVDEEIMEDPSPPADIGAAFPRGDLS